MASICRVAKTGTKQLRDDAFLKAIGKRIGMLRRERGFTQTDLAMKINEDADYSQIARMERGEVNFSISYLKAVADALSVPAHELLLPISQEK